MKTVINVYSIYGNGVMSNYIVITAAASSEDCFYRNRIFGWIYCKLIQ